MFYINNNITTTHRYDMAKFMDFVESCFAVLDSYMFRTIENIPYSGTLLITTQEYRPDLLSYDIYGDVQYWWILMLYNGLVSPKQLKNGLLVKFPSLTNVENLYYTLVTQQKTKDSNSED